MTPEQEAEEMARMGLLGVGGSEVRRKVAERLRVARERAIEEVASLLEEPGVVFGIEEGLRRGAVVMWLRILKRQEGRG